MEISNHPKVHEPSAANAVRLHDQEKQEPAIGLLELSSIALGYVVTDGIAKKAPVRILRAQTTSPGKFLLLFTGDVGSVMESFELAMTLGGDAILDHVMIPNLDPQVFPALNGVADVEAFDSLGIIETFSLPSAIAAADKAVKTAAVQLIEIRAPFGLGGKSFLTMTGTLEDMEAAIEDACAIIPPGMLCRHALIANPHEDLNHFVF